MDPDTNSARQTEIQLPRFDSQQGIRPEGASPPRRVAIKADIQFVYLGCRIIQVGEINLRQQLWKVRFDLFCEWLHPSDSQHPPYLLENWQPTWEPLLRYTNADDYEIANKMYMTFPKTGFVGYRVTVSGNFRMEADLTAFPFDVQALPIIITLGRERYSRKLLHYNVAQFMDAPNHANMIMAQSSDEYRFRPLRFNLFKTSKSEGVDGQVMSQWMVVAPVRRVPFYYFVNHYMVAAVIQLMSFGVFAMKPGENRLILLTTIFVVLMAFKMTLSGEIPRVPKMTHLDKYLNYGFTFMFAMYVYAGVSCSWTWNDSFDEDSILDIENAARTMAAAFFIIQQVGFLILAMYHVSLWPETLRKMGELDDQTLKVMAEDGFEFKDGVLVGDLCFKKLTQRPSLFATNSETVQGNTEEWPTLDEEDVRALTNKPPGADGTGSMHHKKHEADTRYTVFDVDNHHNDHQEPGSGGPLKLGKDHDLDLELDLDKHHIDL